MRAVHDKNGEGVMHTCPNCGIRKAVKLAKPAEEQPHKKYCIECGHEWWEFEGNVREPHPRENLSTWTRLS
jgi:predicted RNA-binding Zn-ribbon protein involved in translation (DUF1610 family)